MKTPRRQWRGRAPRPGATGPSTRSRRYRRRTRGSCEAADRLFAALAPIENINRRRPPDTGTSCDPAARRRRPRPGRSPARRRYGSRPVALSGRRVAPDRRSAMAMARRRRALHRRLRSRRSGRLARELAARLRTLHLATHQPVDQTLRGGTQTDGPLFARIEPEIRALRQAVVAAVEAISRDCRPAIPAIPCSRRRARRSVSRAPGRCGSATRAITSITSTRRLDQLGLLCRVPEGRWAAPDHAGWLSLGELTELGLDLAADQADRAEARAAGPVSLDDVARHADRSRSRRAVDGRVRRRQAGPMTRTAATSGLAPALERFRRGDLAGARAAVEARARDPRRTTSPCSARRADRGQMGDRPRRRRTSGGCSTSTPGDSATRVNLATALVATSAFDEAERLCAGGDDLKLRPARRLC